MRLLDRYLLRELLVPLGFCLSGFLIFWIASDLITELGQLQEHKLLAGDIVQLYLVKMPEFVVLVLPIALLLALLYALTNHARHHEITAMRAAGISMWRLCLPYLLVGFVASAILFVCNEFWVPNSGDRAEQILHRRVSEKVRQADQRHVRNLAFNNTREQRLWRITEYDAKNAAMLNPQVIWTQPDGSRVWLYAERALRLNGVWTFFKVKEFKESPQAASLLVPLLQTNLLAMPSFSETPEQIKSEIKISDSISLHAARKTDVPVSEIFNYLRLHSRLEPKDQAWLYTKLHGRLAAPWTCLVVVLIAVPFGAPSGRRNVFVGVASSIVICFAYFVLQQVCLALGTGGHVPPWVAGWAPVMAFGVAGLWLTARVR